MNRTAALALLVTSHFMLNLDSAIIEVALPAIKNGLHFSFSGLSWVANSYILAFGGFLLLGGRLGDVFGGRRVFTWGLLAFGCASLLGGVASSPGAVVIARAAQGLAAAAISPTALSLLVSLYPDGTPQERAKRHKALGTLGAIAAAGGTAGYFLGGLLTEFIGWKATFLINVPAAAVAAYFACRVLPPDRALAGRKRIGVFSAATASIGMTLLVYAFVGAEPSHLFTARTCAVLVLSLLLLFLVVIRQRRSADPLFPLHILRIPQIRGANMVAALINMSMGPVIFFLSLYIQQVLDYSPLAAGLAILPIVAMVSLSSRLTGTLLTRFGVRTVTVGGLTLFGAGLVWLGGISGQAYWAEVLGPEALIGFGGGFVFVTFTVSGTVGLDPHDTGAASGLLTTAQKVGSALGLALLSTVTARVGDEHTLTAGYGAAMLAAAVPVALAVVVSLRWLPGGTRR
ncbi:MFS transporter [Streptomyces sp. HP-A2021]|uniref:MFS transporter n=1 Tax=Streptomyces sp. HP-A2021 TaxID=2927875 RepID=UPI001FB0191E|nr:MFS transporter [Streptomyces sp. HP-A2021]UOB12719.1 MFS transporter [Streptomyces sp. HP-A2021]